MNIKQTIDKIGLPRVIIVAFLFLLIITAALQGQNMATLASDVLVRFGMNGVLSLAMVPAIICGTGLNFGVAVGIIAGLLSGIWSIELGLKGIAGVIFALVVSIPFSVAFGYLYGKLLNSVKGSEMVVGTYVGYSVISLMCIGWLLLPFKSPNLVWPIAGTGLRNTITLNGYYEGIFNKFLAFKIFGITVPTGLILVFALACFLTLVFTRTKVGVAMKAAGSNPMYAKAAGIDVNQMRILGTVLSTAFAAIGIIVYAQAFGFYQLYNAPLNMAFAPVAAVLLGGASTNHIKISNVVIGTLLFQALITIALPVANLVAPEGGLAEVSRLIVSNGIILYALTQSGGRK